MALQALVDIIGAGDHLIISGAAGQPINVTRVVLSLASQTTVQFKAGSTPLSGPMPILQMVLDQQAGGGPWYTTAAGQGFIISLGVAGISCGGTLWFTYGQ